MSGVQREREPHFSIVLEDLLDLVQPAHIQHLCEICPFRLSGRTHETAMFGRHAKPFDVSQVVCQEVAIAAGDDVYKVLGV